MNPPFPAATPGPNDPPWEELLAWAESDLRFQVESGLQVAAPVRPSSIIESTLLWAVSHRERLHRGVRHATSLLAGVARFIQREKFRYVSRQRRRPASGHVIQLGDPDDLVSPELPSDPAMREAVAQLPAEMQALIQALYWDLRSCREYARHTGQSEKMVERAHKRALEKLSRMLGTPAPRS